MSRRGVYAFERAPGGREVRPGEWRPLLLTGARQFTATVCCPTCETIHPIDGHRIASDGTVTPSLLCPTAGCSFHQFGRLEGWAELDQPRSGT